MAKDPSMTKLEVRQGININKHICLPGEYQVNLPSGIINTFHNTQFIGSNTE